MENFSKCVLFFISTEFDAILKFMWMFSIVFMVLKFWKMNGTLQILNMFFSQKKYF